MTVDKPYLNGAHAGRDVVENKLLRLDSRRVAAGKQNVPANQQSVQRAETAAALDPVRVSNVSRELSAALGPTAMDEVFDHDKVESIRREIREGRFPIDEERLAKKFRELEQELGDLGA
jgi:flagellar biosynthesis anti-sigma factor FlgM